MTETVHVRSYWDSSGQVRTVRTVPPAERVKCKHDWRPRVGMAVTVVSGQIRRVCSKCGQARGG